MSPVTETDDVPAGPVVVRTDPASVSALTEGVLTATDVVSIETDGAFAEVVVLTVTEGVLTATVGTSIGTAGVPAGSGAGTVGAFTGGAGACT